MIWAAILTTALGCYLLKYAGLALPESVLAKPRIQRIANLLPIALLAALIAVQTVAGASGQLSIDARLVGLASAVVALLLRAPFLLVVFVAAATTAGFRFWFGG